MSHMFVPGPVDVDPEVLAAQDQPMIPHRSKEFEEIFRRSAEKAKPLFGTQNRVFISTSSGTGLQEAAIRNLAKQDVLSCVNGAFGNRWYAVAVSNGKNTTKLDFPWNSPIDADKVADAVREKHYEVITIVHNETSTGMENPVAEVAAAVRAVSPDTLICVDAVSSLGGVKIEADAWGVDMVLASSQKCLALPPGLSLACVSDRAMAYAEEVPNRGWYFDLLQLEKHRIKDSTPATPAVSLIYALDVQLDRILAEGLENRFTRHAAMAQQVRDWAIAKGFGLYAPEGYRSKTVTTVENRLEIDIAELNSYLLEQGMRIANGYGQLKNKTFRIAHMGETQPADIDLLLKAFDTFLNSRES